MIYKHMNGANLASYYHITIEVIEDGTPRGAKQVTFHSAIHVNKAVTCPITYSLDYKDFEILNDYDFTSWVYRNYGSVAA